MSGHGNNRHYPIAMPAVGASRVAQGVGMDEHGRVDEFLRLFSSHEVRLRGLALSLVPRWSDAGDVLQEANLIMWKRFDQFQSGTNFFAWASRIVKLKAKEFRRRKNRDDAVFSVLTDELMDTLAEQTEGMGAEFEERYTALEACLEKLKPEQRRLLELRYSNEGTLVSAAMALGRSVDAVYQTVSRLRHLLVECVNRRLAAAHR